MLAFKREGRLYIATSCFIPRYIVNNVCNKFFCNQFQLKLFLKENFCFNLKMLWLDQIFFIIASISSNISNFISSGYSSKSRFLVIRMKIIFKAFATWGLSSKVFFFNKENICFILCMFIGEIWHASWRKWIRVIFCFKIGKKNRFYNTSSVYQPYLLLFIIDYIIFWLIFHSFFLNWERFIIAKRSAL